MSATDVADVACAVVKLPGTGRTTNWPSRSRRVASPLSHRHRPGAHSPTPRSCSSTVYLPDQPPLAKATPRARVAAVASSVPRAASFETPPPPPPLLPSLPLLLLPPP
ncbi:hypothetical protein DBV15_04380 [Temnothorax longispinosus]|uniref:Uncharacterized protein n=1 Tax=Temnothorax longispinosus TaxID=300112 RepID=A0A4V3SA93_9HYME|nr:hypothetical protein DBV15_04380 [Temnothorax longispinosus]